MQANNTRLSQIDTIKLLGIILIVFYHTWDKFNYPLSDKLMQFYSICGTGNYIFFMVSGYLISNKYREKIIRGLSFKDFFVKRYISIYPVYFISVVFEVFVICLLGAASTLTVRNLVLEFLMIPSGWISEDLSAAYNTPTWFVSVLLLCYIVYYIIVRASEKHPNTYPVGIILMIVWGIALMERSWGVPFLFRIDGEGYATFFIGVCIAEICSKIKKPELEKKVGLICFLVLLLVSIMGARFGFENISGDIRWTQILLATCILYLAVNNNLIGKILSFKIFSVLGKMTMEICFFHIPILGTYLYIEYNVKRFIASDTINWAAYWSILFIFAALFHVFISKRLNMVKVMYK